MTSSEGEIVLFPKLRAWHHKLSISWGQGRVPRTLH